MPTRRPLELGAKVSRHVADSNGYVVDEPDGIDYQVIKEIKEVKSAARIGTYLDYVPDGQVLWRDARASGPSRAILRLPCATQNEIDEESAKTLVANGVQAVAEGANMPYHPRGCGRIPEQSGFYLARPRPPMPAVWPPPAWKCPRTASASPGRCEEVDHKLKTIMANIHANAVAHAQEYSSDKSFTNYVTGANIAGFVKVADSMIDQGVV